MLALQLGGCGFIVVRTARHIYSEYTKEETAVDAALARYQDAVLRQEPDKVAAMVESAAELSMDAGTPIVGREDIRAFFASQIKPAQFELKPNATTVTDDKASQRGTYRRKTVGSSGEPELLEGSFEAHWARKPGGSWLLLRMHMSTGTGKKNP